MAERDCEHCIHKVPVFDEDGYCKYAQCDSWNCEYVNRKEALEAWKQINGLKSASANATKTADDLFKKLTGGDLP